MVVGVLGVLAALAAAFVAMAQLERRASEQRVNAARAYLLARSGIEDALARLSLGQDPAYAGEDWDDSGALNGLEIGAEVHRRGILDTEACPLRHALRPSFFVRFSPGSPDAALIDVDGRKRGLSGRLREDAGYALKVGSSNGRIFVNGGALDAEDRDPDGPNAAPEAAPLVPNHVPDHRDASMEGPNGFLVRLLNNLDAILTEGGSARLGEEILGKRPLGGYRTLAGLPERAKPYLTLHAWVDPKVIKPQPMDGRPSRWQDIDDAHRVGSAAAEISGYTTAGGGNIRLDPDLSGTGKEGDPWVQRVEAVNAYEREDDGKVDYPVSWERGFIYARSQLRLGPGLQERRAPVSVAAASPEALAAVFRGLRGTALEVWDGSAGWDGGFGWFGGKGYPYPDQATEETPWIRTRVDYGMTYGSSQRPWYGPAAYDPHATPEGGGGKPLLQSAPLGRLKESAQLTQSQALALASRMKQELSFRTWERFNAFVDALPRWEDLDGAPYQVDGGPPPGGGGIYTRRVYKRGDRDSDGVINQEHFPDGTPGLTFVQKDVLKAMANPNTDLNDFNPDANLFKEVDKTDLLAHTTELALDEAGYALVESLGRVLGKDGRLLGQHRLGATFRAAEIHRDSTQADFMRDYAAGRPLAGIFSALPAPYPLSGGQPLLSYPEPQTVQGDGRAADAAYDGQIGLGLIGALPMIPYPDDTLRGDLFDTADAADTGDTHDPDLRGPRQARLLEEGGVFPDGVYSGKDRALRYRFEGNLPDPDPEPPQDNSTRGIVEGVSVSSSGEHAFYLACWVKPDWLPEASPRAHALVSLSRAAENAGLNRFNVPTGRGVPLDDIPVHPTGLYFVPARNNLWEGATGTYKHDPSSTRGKAWPRRSLLWGTTHSLFASSCLNRRGIAPAPPGPPAPLEGRRWQHLAVIGLMRSQSAGEKGSQIILGRVLPSADHGGGWNRGFEVYDDDAMMFGTHRSLGSRHADGSPNHIRFGEIAALTAMNYAADATFAHVRAGHRAWTSAEAGGGGGVGSGDVVVGGAVGGAVSGLSASTDPLGPWKRYRDFFSGPLGPAALGRYQKEDGARFTAPGLPAGIRPLRITWTAIPAAIWLDGQPAQDRFGALGLPVPNGLGDLRVDLEIWDDRGTSASLDDVRLAVFQDPAGENRLSGLPFLPAQRLYYKAVFVNEWDAVTRLNHPLDVTPFLDDVTVTIAGPGGPAVLAWMDGEAE